MIKLIAILLISLSPSTAQAQVYQPTECQKYVFQGMQACAKVASTFTPGSVAYNNTWFACVYKFQASEKAKQCQKEANETTTR